MRSIEGRDEALRWFATRGVAEDGEAAAREVDAIIAEVRAGGDEVLLRLSERFDGVRPASLVVGADEIAAAEGALAPGLAASIRLAAERIRAYYQRQPAGGFVHAEGDTVLGQLVLPIERVGCYVPGGTAPLFSSLLMTAIPAKVAGVPHIVVATPPRRDGSVAPEILFAAHLVGVDTVVRVGGAQAIAALAFGTASVPRVDKIVGPGNRYVVLAKRALFGHVGIEALPGPTETLVVADDTADAHHVVADLLAQAEHAYAQPVLVTTDRALADAVLAALPGAIASLPTAATARESVDDRGVLVLVNDLDEALEVANAYAPEHLCLLVQDPWRWLPRVKNAGGVFLGAYSMEALGDYLAGPSHVMPTSGTARFASFVNVRDFQKVVPLFAAGPGLVAQVGPAAAAMARAEGLEAHARAIEARLDDED
ncbi:MAG: histidinol dehydrogenase [Trueperaceae bacterium]